MQHDWHTLMYQSHATAITLFSPRRHSNITLIIESALKKCDLLNLINGLFNEGINIVFALPYIYFSGKEIICIFTLPDNHKVNKSHRSI